MRYHVIVLKGPDLLSNEEIPFIDREFDFSGSSYKVMDVFDEAIYELERLGGTSDR